MAIERGYRRGVRQDSWESDITGRSSFSEESSQTDEFAEQSWPEWKGVEHFTNLNLFKAIDRGDLRATKHFLDQQSDALTGSLTENKDTPLHKAVLSGHKKIVREIVRRIQDLGAFKIKNSDGYTPLAYAAVGGIVGIAKCLVEKCPDLVSIENNNRQMPIVIASLYGHKDLVQYLYSVTNLNDLDPSDENKGKNGAMLVTTCIMDGLYGIALDLIHRYPKLVYTKDHDKDTAIMVLAQTPAAFPSGTSLAFWQRWIYSCVYIEKHHKDPNHNESTKPGGWPSFQETLLKYLKFLFPPIIYIYNLKLEHVLAKEILNHIFREISKMSASQLQSINIKETLFKSVENGIIEYVKEMLKHNPDVLWYRNNDGCTMFFCAVYYRQEKIFSLIYKMGAMKNILANALNDSGTNMLHQVAFLPPISKLHRDPGAALQMQRELQWFKEVESLVQPKRKKMVNWKKESPQSSQHQGVKPRKKKAPQARSAGQTTQDSSEQLSPQAIFTKEHKKLVEKGEKWMKETAKSCTVVAALIATMVFSAAFTIPGDYTEEGTPRFLHHKSFMLFIVSDAISLFTSCVSLLMFLGILRSRYEEEDFLQSLPTKLIIGLSSLFLSMATMMVSFVVMLTIMLTEKVSWVSLPVVLLAMIPVAMFAVLQFPVLLDITYSTYGPGIFDKPRKHSPP